jgi:hypothetical protein
MSDANASAIARSHQKVVFNEQRSAPFSRKLLTTPAAPEGTGFILLRAQPPLLEKETFAKRGFEL